MFLIYDQPIGTGRCECLRYNGGGDEAQISTQWVLTLVDAFLHADHDRAPKLRRGHHNGSTHHRIGPGNGFDRTSIECAQCPVRVKMRNTRKEQTISA